ncbi:MAG: L-histidine N(alpha)-methyltransferase [Pseudomonadota bacterium]|uniref:L-histidine N(alpha)-methyltransferase n=1 Tax=Polaromonas sp. TaxID=1869339 RepID=UPI001810173A|nr:L-histidine N(alpha)-methyltransferase [Polaromonas sp.]MBA3593821.1 L-histidine N(alpha)-methyltransferase [Polaromonas sp.]MDQ3272759.1 L-histidine N(alpha)-methyltransferase [Pseudomonadota bacterium]
MNLPLKPPGLALAPAAPRFINRYSDTLDGQPRSALQDLADGLNEVAASVSPKYFYDALGSKLFEAITQLDEYYPTRTEACIFRTEHAQMASALGAAGVRRPCLIDLGAGNCAKAASLIPHLQPQQYVPVDISVEFLRDAAEQVQGMFPALDVVAVGMDFSAGLVLPPEVQTSDRVFFYPGSSLGNFSSEEALAFLRRISDPAQGGARGLLLGIDLVKDKATLEAAYDDTLGVTAAFNKNLLRHVNRLLGSDFDARHWQHLALFNEAESRIEMHLQAQKNLTVRWPGGERSFRGGERIHTESSYKYTLASMSALLRQAGFTQINYWTDPKGWFAVFWAAV